MKRLRMKPARALVRAAFGLLLLCTSVAGWGALRARLDRQTVEDGGTATLTIESDRAQAQQRPDLGPLRKDFDVLGTSTRSETSIVDGNRSSSTSWQIRLRPRHRGSLTIPPITLGGEQTAPLTLEVAGVSPQEAQQTAGHVFLEVDSTAAGKPVYVQQQIAYTVRLYYDDTVRDGTLAAPDPADAVVEQLGGDRRYQAFRNGRAYTVIERHYAISPEKSGALRIPPASFHGTRVAASSGQGIAGAAGGLMARMLRNTPFANDPMFKSLLSGGMALAAPAQPVDIRSRALSLEVRPLPAGVHGNWLPAEQLSLHDSWVENPPQFEVGEPVTRTITVEAKGLAASQIPPLSFARPANARIYPEAPRDQSRTDGDDIYGVSKQSVTYIPTSQGTLRIAPVELAWWNTRTDAPSTATLPAWQIRVAPDPDAGRLNAAAPPAASAPPQAPAAAPSARQAIARAPARDRLREEWAWLAAGAGLLAMAIVAVLAVLRSRRAGSTPDPAAAAPVPQRKAALRALRRACAADDRYAAADALLDLAWARWPEDAPRGLGALAARLDAGATEIRALDRSLYGAAEAPWQGSALWHAVRNGLQAARSDKLPEGDGLGALYP